ncbi:hypothetical protein ACJIZ3_022468 [Penstemon smallii]|uniref:Uncharacterized protein n=1 Tax=Penstemon smallii TaxID=265156 RepID=A0ABD3TND9_9LAMI
MKNKKSFSVPKTKPGNTLFRPAIPVGPAHEADLPVLTTRVAYNSDDTTRWLGTKVWPVENTHMPDVPIGRGRDTNVQCTCQHPGSSKCIMRHVKEKKVRLKSELGPAYSDMGFDKMGDEASKNLSTMQKIKLDAIMTKEKQGFLKSALKSLPKLTRETIIGYYFNVTVPNRIGWKTRDGLSAEEIDSDGEKEEKKITTEKSEHMVKPAVKRYLNGPR